MISIVIPAYNEEKTILPCLYSLAQQQALPDEIIVVNNASRDRTAELVQQFIANHPQLSIKLLHEAKKGVHHAREAGWRTASGDIIVQLDADEVLAPNWLAKIKQILAANPQLDVIGGAYRFENPPLIIWLTQVLYNVIYPRVMQTSSGFPYLVGGMTIAKRAVFEKMNGYLGKPDDQLEDYYFSEQSFKLGYKIRYRPDILGTHSLRRYEAGGLSGFLQWGVAAMDSALYENDVR
ncbi:MAG: glycosyltransferase family 2 protein [Chloroflexota bacterium]